ncbi:MAG: gephyrin-like molybdotransferase Glp [Candidatus Omnitrophota bacterium]
MNESLLSYREALRLIEDHLTPLPIRRINWRCSIGAALAEDVAAIENLPPFTNTSMDGYAVRSEDVQGASENRPVRLHVAEAIFAGDSPSRQTLQPGWAAKIMTGAPLPQGADAVIMVEYTKTHNDSVDIFSSAQPGENLRPEGEEIRRGDVLLPLGIAVGPVERGLLAQQGIREVSVRQPPRAALLATGDELVEPESEIVPGQIRNVNAYTLAAELERLRCPVADLGIGRDDPGALRDLIRRGVEEADLLIASGGVSAGERDFLPGLLRDMGMRTIFHKASVKPGKPILFGLLDERPIFGLPGNVVSVIASFHLFVKPSIKLMMGRKDWRNTTMFARMGQLVHNPGSRTHFMRCRLSHMPSGAPIAYPTGKQESGMLTSLLGADGFAVIPGDVDTVEEFTEVEFIPLRDDR